MSAETCIKYVNQSYNLYFLHQYMNVLTPYIHILYSIEYQ